MAIGFLKALGLGAKAIAAQVLEQGGSIARAALELASRFPSIDQLAAYNIAGLAAGQRGVSAVPDTARELRNAARQRSGTQEGTFQKYNYIYTVTWVDPSDGEVQQYRAGLRTDELLSLSELRAEAIRQARIQSEGMSPEVEGGQFIDESEFDFELLYFFERAD